MPKKIRRIRFSKLKDVKDMNDAREKMKRSELNGIIELPSDWRDKNNGNHPIPTGTMNVIYPKGSEQTGGALVAVMNQITNSINSQMGQPEAPLKAVGKAVGDEQLKSFDYIFTGLLTFSLISMVFLVWLIKCQPKRSVARTDVYARRRLLLVS